MVMVPGLIWSGSAQRKVVELFRQRTQLEGQLWRQFPPYTSKSGPYQVDAILLNLAITNTIHHMLGGLQLGQHNKIDPRTQFLKFPDWGVI